MAKIYLNIEADDAIDLQRTLEAMLVRAITVTIPAEPKANPTPGTTPNADVSLATDLSSAVTNTQENTVLVGTGAVVTFDASHSDELDAHGHPWNPELHASTKGKTQDGLWRMGKGKVRPDPMPGYPKTDEAPAAETKQEEPAPALTPIEQLGAEAIVEAAVEDDAEMWADAAGEAPAVPAREWTDADLSKLCNQAAKTLGPDRVPELKALVAVYTASGQVPHSRNIPVEDRDRFAGEVEALAGITYEG